MSKPIQSRLADFVQQRVMDRIYNEDLEKREASKQGLTIRLDPGSVRGLDHMAKELELSRQALLLQIVTSGLEEVIAAWATEHGDKAQEVHRQIQKIMAITAEDL